MHRVGFSYKKISCPFSKRIFIATLSFSADDVNNNNNNNNNM